MWSPADNSALPTPEELKKAKEVIDIVQRDLESAMELLAQTQRRVEILRKDLEEQKAWIAPVRRLTFDVLSAIFEWCADIEWDSPVRIAAVSRSWRTIVLDTPRAWSFADLTSRMSNAKINMFFERSRERPLHVCLPGTRRFDLRSVAPRVQCLSFSSLSSPPRTLVFPKLQRLSIFGGPGISIADVNTHQFPTLLHLVTIGTMLHHTYVSTDTNVPFPQLESWALSTSESIGWVHGLRSCQNTLVSLTISGHPHSIMDEQPPILLPVLSCLKLMAYFSRGLFSFKTPRLETYEEDTNALERPIHTDVSTAVQMRFVVEGSPSLSLSCFRGLKRLQIYYGGDNVINSVLDQLLGDGRVCPALQVIELLGEDVDAGIAPYSERLIEINSGRAHAIDMVAITDRTELPGFIPISVGHLFCTMPFTNQIV
jgi:hypothetical protein